MRKLGCGPSRQLQRKIPSFKYLATSARFSWTSLLSDLNVPNTCYSVLQGQHPSHPVFDPSLQWDGGGGGVGGGRLGDECGLFSQTVAGNRVWMNPTLQGLMTAPDEGLDQSHIHKDGGQCHLYLNPLASVCFCFIG